MAEVFGRYHLLKRIGGGGMGEVFLARQPGIAGFEKLLVVKTLLPSLAEEPGFVTMFLDEARLAARLNHPNVCQIYDLGEVNGVLYIAMEYIHGDDLERLGKELRNKGGGLPPALAARIVADAAAGLQHAHQLTDGQGKSLGVIHRDVSPANLLVTFEGEVKLVDFGLAKAANRITQTKSGVLKGKFAYMSPEQLADQPIDSRHDLFSLGIVLHELLTGGRLFRRDTDMQTLAAISQCEVPPPSTRNSEIPPELDAIVLRVLDKDRTKRFADGQSFRFALEEYLRQSRQPSSNVHLAKFMQQLYRGKLDLERSRGPLWDAPEGPVMRLRAVGAKPSVISLEASARSIVALSSTELTEPGPPAPPAKKVDPAETRRTSDRASTLTWVGILGAIALLASAILLLARFGPADSKAAVTTGSTPSAGIKEGK